MEATLILCDHAEAVNGKLYVNGAGWTDMVAEMPVPVALGVILMVPWNAANQPHDLRLVLVDQDEHQISLGEPPQLIGQEGKFEIGRPAGVPAGSDLPVVFAMRWPILPLPVGAYAFVASVDGTELARVRFRSVQPQGG